MSDTGMDQLIAIENFYKEFAVNSPEGLVLSFSTKTIIRKHINYHKAIPFGRTHEDIFY